MTFKKGFTGNEALFSHKKLKTGIKVSTPSNFLILGYFCLIQAMNLSQLALSLNRTNGRKWARYYRAVGIYAVVVGTVVPTNHGRLVYPILIRGADFAHPISLFPPRFLTFRRPCISGREKMCIANNNHHDDCNFLFFVVWVFHSAREFAKKIYLIAKLAIFAVCMENFDGFLRADMTKKDF